LGYSSLKEFAVAVLCQTFLPKLASKINCDKTRIYLFPVPKNLLISRIMSITLNKKTGINLKKGSTISLEKNGKQLEEVCIGLNWGAIQQKTFFNLFTNMIDVDLDGSVCLFDSEGNSLDVVYYNSLRSRDGAIRHSGDDTGGDAGVDDGRDNEIIQLQLNKINPKVQEIYFFLNSFKKQDFASIPFSKIRIFEGNAHQVKDVMATFNLSADDKYKGYVSMIMGKLYRKGNSWEFLSIGEPVQAERIERTIEHIKNTYFNKDSA
jgi:tellurium resistance protein TerZ